MENQYQIINMRKGAYKIEQIPRLLDKDFLLELKKIGFIVGNTIEILDYSTKTDLYIKINGSIYYLRKKLLQGIYVSKQL